MQLKKGNLIQKFSQFSDHWEPKIIAELNGQAVKIAKIKGNFPIHKHENEDEMFYVVKGEIEINLIDQVITLEEGEYVVIPRGVEHHPYAKNEAFILMFEPRETINTGNVINDKTLNELERI